MMGLTRLTEAEKLARADAWNIEASTFARRAHQCPESPHAAVLLNMAATKRRMALEERQGVAWRALQPNVLRTAALGDMEQAETLLSQASQHRQGQKFEHSDLVGKVEEWRRAHFLEQRGVRLLERPQDGNRPDYDLKYLLPEGHTITEEVKADTYTNESRQALNLFVECGEWWNGSTLKPWQDETLKRSGLFSTKADLFTLSRTPLRTWYQAESKTMRDVILGGLNSGGLLPRPNKVSKCGTWGVLLPIAKWGKMPTGVVIPWHDA